MGCSASAPKSIGDLKKDMPDAPADLKEAAGDLADKAVDAASDALSYPPTGLSAGVKELPAWIQAGCGNEEYNCAEKGATFLGSDMPEKCPDISKHSSFMTDALKANPEIYEQLKDKKTSLGVTLGHCIKTGIDNPGHPHIKTCGIVAGDEESLTLFAPIFDPVFDARHNGYGPEKKHVTDMNVANLSDTKIDPSGKYILTTRCRTGRSVSGIKLPPVCSFEERRKVEECVVKGLEKLDGELKGEYFPLRGSHSFAKKPNGMDEAYEEGLRKAGNLFQEPDSTLLLSSGSGRHWPDARGIFHNEARNFFVWINEEDHMRIISMEKGDDVVGIFKRFAKATEVIEATLKDAGFSFMHNDHHGFVLTCPSNCGTGLRAGAMIKIPLCSARPDFKEVCGRMRLQARGSAGVDSAATGGTMDISNADRIGYGETTLVNTFTEGVANIIRWEGMLERGEDIEDEVKNCKPNCLIK